MELRIFPFEKIIRINRLWIQLAIIFATLLISTAVSFWGSERLMMMVLVLIGGIAGLLALMKLANLGFILIFIGGMFIPYSGPGGVNASILMVVLIIGLWLLDMIVVKRKLTFVSSRVMTPSIVFLLIALFSLGIGQIPWIVYARQAPLDAQIGGFAIFFFSVAILIVTPNLIKDIVWLKIIVWVFVGLGTVYVLGRALKLSLADRFYTDGFTAGSMFWTWFVALTVSQAVFNTKLKPRFRIGLAVIVLVTIYVAFVQARDWKSGWVPPLVVLAVIFGLRYRKMTMLAIPLSLILAFYLSKDLIASDEYSWGTRVDAWIIVLEISKLNPIFGLGFANYYWYTPLFPIRGWYVSFNSHSQYVDLIAQTGILGLLCFFWIFLELGLLGWNLIQRLEKGFSQAYTYGAIAGIAGTLMAAFLVDWVLPFVYNIGMQGFRASILPWIFLGGLLSIEQIYKKQNNNFLGS